MLRENYKRLKPTSQSIKRESQDASRSGLVYLVWQLAQMRLVGRLRLVNLALAALLVTVACLATIAYLVRNQLAVSTQVVPVNQPICGTWRIATVGSTLGDPQTLSGQSTWLAGTEGGPTGKARAAFGLWSGTALDMTPGADQQADAMVVNGLSIPNNQDGWAVGNPASETTNNLRALHWDGSSWKLVPMQLSAASSGADVMPSQGTAKLKGVTVVSPDDAWAVGYYVENGVQKTLSVHWNGNEWKVVPTPNLGTKDNILVAVASLAANDIWAFGSTWTGDEAWQRNPLTLHWDGTQWNQTNDPQSWVKDISAASVSPSGDLWVLGRESFESSQLASAVRIASNGQWRQLAMPTMKFASVTSMFAFSANEVWAVGDKRLGYPSDAGPSQIGTRSLVMHWDGTAWSEVPGPDPSYIQSLESVTPAAENDIWVVGSSSENEDAQPRPMIAHFVGCRGPKNDPAKRTP